VVFYIYVYYVLSWFSFPTYYYCEVEAFVGCLVLSLDTSWPMDLPDVSMLALEA
jgi:hypothetical protein